MQWYEGMGRFGLKMTLKQAESCSHPGPCDADVEALIAVPKIRRQINKWPRDILREALEEYGAWEGDNLADHESNLHRMVWIAACDLAEEKRSRRS